MPLTQESGWKGGDRNTRQANVRDRRISMFSFVRNNPMRPAAAAVKAPDELAALGLDCGPRRPSLPHYPGKGKHRYELARTKSKHLTPTGLLMEGLSLFPVSALLDSILGNLSPSGPRETSLNHGPSRKVHCQYSFLLFGARLSPYTRACAGIPKSSSRDRRHSTPSLDARSSPLGSQFQRR